MVTIGPAAGVFGMTRLLAHAAEPCAILDAGTNRSLGDAPVNATAPRPTGRAAIIETRLLLRRRSRGLTMDAPSSPLAGTPQRSAAGRWLPRWAASTPQSTATHSDRALFAFAVAICLVAPALVATGLPEELRLPAVLALLCVAPGAAVRAFGRRAVSAEAGLIVGASLAVAAVLAQTMLWLGAWWPKAFLYLLAAACLVPSLARLRQPRPPRTRESGDRVVPAREHGRAGALALVARRFTRSPAAVHGAVLVAAGLAWGLSLREADLSRMGGLGLLEAMPAAFFVAFGLLLAGFTAAVSRPVTAHRLLWLYAIALILVLHGTTALLYDEPRYTWTYKHLGVIAHITEVGAVDRSVDIYNNWPGFFALAAWVSSVTGVSAVRYAAWAQVFFNLANVAALRFALRGVTNDERLIWTAACFFVLGNWVGQDYLAPQAFAFVLSLVVLGLCLRCGSGPGLPRSRAARWWAGVVKGPRSVVLRRAPVEETPRPAPLTPAGAVLVGGLCYLAIVISHQLTPAILLAGAMGLALIRRVPLWVPVAMGVAEVWWLSRAWPYLSQHYTLFDFAPSSSSAPPGYAIGDGLPGLSLVVYAGRAEVLILVILASVGLVRRLREGRWDLTPVILIGAPLLVVGLQSYSGEGRYRAYLFALPWLSFLAAAAYTPTGGRLPTVTHRARLTLANVTLGYCLLFAYFGLELMNRVDSDDVAAATWFEQHAPSDSLLVGVTGGFPSRLSARYAAVYDPSYPRAPALTDHAAYRTRKLGAADLPRIERSLRGYGASHTFLTFGRGQARYARLYGILPDGSLGSLERALRTSPSFHLVYRRGPSSIFQYGRRREISSEAIR